MSLSIEKLTDICESNGLIPMNFFRYKKKLLYLQTISLKKGFSFMINIPKKYDFDLENSRIDNLYKIKKLRINNETINNPFKSPDNSELDKLYSEIELQKNFDPDTDTTDLESKLLESYKKKIYLSSLDKEEFQQIKDIFRQIQRLKFCVQGIDYKISIIYKNYLCSIDDNDEIECFFIKNFNKGVNRKLFVSLNLNLLFDNIQNLEEHVQQVYDGVNQVLNKSQESHFDKFLVILDTCKDIRTKLNNIKNYRDHISSLINKYETLVSRANHISSTITDKIVMLKKPDNMSNDAHYVNEKNKLENKLENINGVKGKAIEKLASLRDKDSNLLLKSDKILFDNIIMLNNINNNLKELEVK